MTDNEKLRIQAETKLSQTPSNQAPRLTEAARAHHELKVTQVELELQNEELRRSQLQLTAERELYFELYDLAPVGYCTIKEDGLISIANLTIAAMLGVERSALINRSLSQYILKEHHDIYYRHIKQAFTNNALPPIELRMSKKDGAPFWVSLSGTISQAANDEHICRVALQDITSHKLEEDEKYRQLDELRRWQTVTLGREGRINELKREVNELAARLGEQPRYAHVTASH
ncbi:MAG: PAS domain-containing protein [bacterium]